MSTTIQDHIAEYGDLDTKDVVNAAVGAYRAIDLAMHTLVGTGRISIYNAHIVDNLHQALNGLKRALRQNGSPADGKDAVKSSVWLWSDTPESGFTENGFSENGKSAATKNQGKKKQLHEETEDAPLLKEDSGTVVRQLQVEWSAFPSLPSILTMGPKRVTAIRQRIKDPFWLANWKTAIRKAAESDFCKGKNDRQWKADIDWFLRPDTVAKIMEGKYDNRKRTYSGGGF